MIFAVNLSKFQLRKHYQSLRASLAARDKDKAAQEAGARIKQQAAFMHANTLAAYLAYGAELNVAPILEAAWMAKKSCYLPVLEKENSKELLFVAYNYGDPLHKNRFGIYEPKNITDRIAPAELDLVILPLLAFDRKGNRLGTGGGFYDYTFSFLQNAVVANQHPILVGAGFAIQEANDLPHDPWDIRLNFVVTEQEWIICDASS